MVKGIFIYKTMIYQVSYNGMGRRRKKRQLRVPVYPYICGCKLNLALPCVQALILLHPAIPCLGQRDRVVEETVLSCPGTTAPTPVYHSSSLLLTPPHSSLLLSFPGLNNRGKAENMFPATLKFRYLYLACWLSQQNTNWLARSKAQAARKILVDWMPAKQLEDSRISVRQLNRSLLGASQMAETNPNGWDSTKLMWFSQMAGTLSCVQNQP